MNTIKLQDNQTNYLTTNQNLLSNPTLQTDMDINLVSNRDLQEIGIGQNNFQDQNDNNNRNMSQMQVAMQVGINSVNSQYHHHQHRSSLQQRMSIIASQQNLISPKLSVMNAEQFQQDPFIQSNVFQNPRGHRRIKSENFQIISKDKNQSMIESVNNNNLENQSHFQSQAKTNSGIEKCVVCMDLPANSVFMDCMHGGVCYDCGLNMWKRQGECHLCRQQIFKILEVDIENLKNGVWKVISSTKLVGSENDGEQADIQESSVNSGQEIEIVSNIN